MNDINFWFFEESKIAQKSEICVENWLKNPNVFSKEMNNLEEVGEMFLTKGFEMQT